MKKLIVKENYSKENLKCVYNDLYSQFEKSEVKDKEQFDILFENDNYKLLLCYDGKKLIGYIIVYIDIEANLMWLDYLAVLENYHSKGYGTQMIKTLKNWYKNLDGCMIEVEKEDDKDINTYRRIKFYENLGCIKLDINYILPTKESGLSMHLYYLPFSKELIQITKALSVINSAHSTIHSDITHVAEIFTKIEESLL
ncbi:MAG: GNAT family N-acetyltransferase [Tepidibacter sp.]|jgi:GNAT superfamily N-acetyltransferase|uniref:GNAT family N-acetyltransferase n=1 Tax=Tepidibacter sp. TaxID=2529387 RepID=UPI0025F954F1|nr:GNAT family N-acetyltransferase [Tepidibacter sp.]MCT4509654.1 GNAT family N-acetyltransferase [Tepidibacter sp.]